MKRYKSADSLMTQSKYSKQTAFTNRLTSARHFKEDPAPSARISKSNIFRQTYEPTKATKLNNNDNKRVNRPVKSSPKRNIPVRLKYSVFFF